MAECRLWIIQTFRREGEQWRGEALQRKWNMRYCYGWDLGGWKTAGQERKANKGRVSGGDCCVYEEAKRLNWTSLLAELRKVPKVGSLGGMKGTPERRYQLSVLLISMVNNICIVIMWTLLLTERCYNIAILGWWEKESWICIYKITKFLSSLAGNQ